jgi:DNA replication initiation complex subunit (GINS family)
MSVEDNMTPQERDLHAALCQFCNEAGDPFTPASEWNENVEHAFGVLCKAYDAWYSSKSKDFSHA